MEDEKKAVEQSDDEESAASAAAAEPTIEDFKAGLEAEKALREIAESEASNAKKDLIAIKTGKKRKDIDLTAPEAATNNSASQPQSDTSTLATALAEANRVNAELARAMSARGQSFPSGGSGQAEAPAPKPKGYWSEEQKAFLKAKRGLSDAQISKAEKLAQFGGATGPRNADDNGVAKRPY